LPATFTSAIHGDAQVGLFYAHLSTAPQSYLRETLLYTYREVDRSGVSIGPLADVGQVKLRRLVFNTARLGGIGARIKWAAEKHIEPRFESCPVSRNQALREMEACLVSRNDPMHDSVPYLQNNLPATTDILQEYFVPHEHFGKFVDGLRERLRSERVTLLNASVRAVPAEDAFLSYAPGDRLAVVLYLAQSTDREGSDAMARVTSDLIDLSTRLGGRFFLPYQLHYSEAQLAGAYPEIREFFRAKRAFDPDGLFTSTFYRRFGESL
jgi:FAD/FMN-containing dehydrogenase